MKEAQSVRHMKGAFRVMMLL